MRSDPFPARSRPARRSRRADKAGAIGSIFAPTRPWIALPVGSKWLALEHPRADLHLRPSLPTPSQGDATYIVVKDDGSIEKYGINAVCTHLGCVVPWNKAENKFKCPCHGSQYNNEGKVIRGPAPLSLALAHAEINETDTIIFAPLTETDFRTRTRALVEVNGETSTSLRPAERAANVRGRVFFEEEDFHRPPGVADAPAPSAGDRNGFVTSAEANRRVVERIASRDPRIAPRRSAARHLLE